MILKNFEIHDSYGIEFDGKFLDLHSNYDFVRFGYDISSRSAELEWKKNPGRWAAKEPFAALRLNFRSISVFAVKSRDENQPHSEDNCLSYIGYLHPQDIDVMNGFLPAKMKDSGFHMVLGFESGLFIKVYCEEIELSCWSDAA